MGALSRKNRIKKPKKQKQSLRISSSGLRATVFITVLILGAGVFLWWQFIFNDAERVFQDMLKNSMRTHSITKVINQDAGAQSLRQVSRLQLGEEPAVVGRTVIEQAGPATARVVTEEIGTPELDYVRYVSITTSELDANEEEIDFSDVIGEWGVSDEQPAEAAQGEGFSEAVLGIIPLGNLRQADQRELLNFLQEFDVYEIDHLGVTRSNQDGRPVYSYPISLQPEAYVTYLQQFARAQGLTQLQNINPADFRGVAPIRFTVDVDILSRQPILIEYGQDQRQERLRDYGRIQEVDIPEEAIPASELQRRIQAIQ